jgi:hypothetical protein
MWRVILSIISGLIIPFVCFMAIGITTDYMQPSALTEIKIFDEPAPGILLAPFSIPIYCWIFLKTGRIAPQIFDTFWFRFSSLILFNWILYGIIFYFLLGYLKRFKKQKAIVSDAPPPPVFEQKLSGNYDKP